MASKWIETKIDERDGTSQAGRRLNALSPSYVSVDERTAEDFLDFVREYSNTLVYFGEDDAPAGKFSELVSALPLAQVAAFMREPDKADPALFPQLFRPHFVLLLAFLKLFEKTQAELNALTGRHLDFYYRRFLRLEGRKAVPDRMTLLLKLADRSPRVLVPAGTSVSAGPDSQKRDRIYRTARDIIVSRAEVASIASLFLDRRHVGIRRCITEHRNNALDGRPELLRIVYGAPQPGDPLPAFSGNNVVDDNKLRLFWALVKFAAPATLFLSLSELRELMLRKEAVVSSSSNANNARWNRVNDILERAARRRTNNSTTKLMVRATSASTFTGAAAAAFGSAGLRVADPSSPSTTYTYTIEQYWAALKDIEAYFFMPVERFGDLMAELFGDAIWDVEHPGDVRLVESILVDAFRERTRAARRAALKAIHDDARFTAAGLAPIAQFALGEEPTAVATFSAVEDRLFTVLTEIDIERLKKAATVAGWSEVYGILELAMRNRLGEPPPEKEIWLNLYPAADATLVRSTRLAGDPEGQPPWSIFGKRAAEDPQIRPTPVIGFALSSPVLVLREGERKITLTLGLLSKGLEPEVLQRLQSLLSASFTSENATLKAFFPFTFEVSTAKGWIRCWLNSAPKVDYYSLLVGAGQSNWDKAALCKGVQFSLTVGSGVDPIAPLPAALGGTDGRWPVLRVMMQPIYSTPNKQYLPYYKELAGLLVGAAHVKVDVSKLTALALENDQGALNPKKPFEPFGSAPCVGAHLFLGHPEVVTKKLDSLSFNFEWVGVPADLQAHYGNYGLANLAMGTTFLVKVSSMDRSGETFLRASSGLFTSSTWSLPQGPTAYTAADPATAALGALGDRPSTWRRYLQWELLSPDFHHAEYAAAAAKKALEYATTKETDVTKVTKYVVNPPYTPKIKSLTLNYSSSAEVVPGLVTAGDAVDRMVHVHPFGCCDVEAERTLDGVPLLPRYSTDSELYIGLRDASPPETVSLLFQFAEGTADRDLITPKVTWSCLSGDRWVPFDRRVLSDTTRGLLTSGIVELGVEPVKPSTRMPAGLTWIRAAIARDSEAINDAIDIHAQAVEAVFADQNNAPDHYNAAVPGGAVKKLQTDIPSVAGVRQPYPSWGGRMAEDPSTFATRVSERLRHKQRALSAWDYERLVLDRFPEIFKAKCIAATSGAPGSVDVIVIPDLRLAPSDPFEPKVQPELLAAIQAYLAARCPASVTIKVRNPHYRAVLVRLGVRFTDDNNESFYRAKLEEDLSRFLSPWAFDDGADLALGGRIYSQSIINFVDRRPYVNFVAGIHLFYSDDDAVFTRATPPSEDGTYFVQTDAPDMVLVSARRHRIDVLVTEVYDERSVSGVGFMELELDFYVV